MRSRVFWIPAFAGMTNETLRVPVMLDLIPHPVTSDFGLSGRIAQFKFWVCTKLSLFWSHLVSLQCPDMSAVGWMFCLISPLKKSDKERHSLRLLHSAVKNNTIGVRIRAEAIT
jgi:hypothetical protein